MFRILTLVLELFQSLPWWAALSVIVLIIAGLWLAGKYIFHRLVREAVDAIKETGLPLEDARVTVHAVEPARRPSEPSPFDVSEDEEDDISDSQYASQDDPADFFQIDVTITPTDPEAQWQPEMVFLVAADFEEEEDLEFCEDTFSPHSVEVFQGGRFKPFGGDEVTGPQRLRILYGVRPGFREAKFSYLFTPFGGLTLPAPIVAGTC